MDQKAHRTSRHSNVKPPAPEFRLAWPAEERRQTTAELNVLIDEEVVWPVPGEENIRLEIQIDDLLSYLTEFWKPLLLRQVYPIPVKPERPSLLRFEAARRWANQPPEVVEREEEHVAAFEEAHDVSRCFAGLFELPSLWLLRSGLQMQCETAGHTWLVPFDAAREALALVGDTIAERLAGTGEQGWQDLDAAWDRRELGRPNGLSA